MTLDTSKNTADLFRDLNTLRKQHGILPLKAWKESRSKLEAAITKLCAEPDAPAEKDAAKMFVESSPKTRPNKMKDVGTPPIVPRKAKASTFADYLRDNKINAKVARAKLRRAGLKGPYALTADVKKIVTP